MNIEKLISKIPEGNSTAIETLKATYPDEFREYEAKQWFKKDILNKLTKKVDKQKYPNSVFYFINDKWFLEFEYDQDGKNDRFWVRYNDCWSVFEDRFHYNYTEIQGLIKGMVEEHFKMKVVTPDEAKFLSSKEVEEHFKMKVVTPFILNEKYPRIGWMTISK